MTPAAVLIAVVVVTVVAYAVNAAARGRERRAVQALAAEWRTNFGADDTLRLTPRVARRFPVPGAANVAVRNVLYGLAGDRYRYVFTAEYTTGVVGAKRRHVRVATFTELRDRSASGTGAANADGPPDASPVVLAAADLPLVEQYRSFAPERAAAAAAAAPTATSGVTPSG